MLAHAAKALRHLALDPKLHCRAPRKLKVLQASGQHKKMPYGIMAADYKYAENEIFR